MKVVRLSALGTDQLYPPGNIPGIHFCQRLSQTQGPSAAGRIMSKKISMIPSGIEPATFRLVAQCLNQLRNRVPHSLRLPGIYIQRTLLSAKCLLMGTLIKLRRVTIKLLTSVLPFVRLFVVMGQHDSHLTGFHEV